AGYNFLVKIDGITRAAFSECSGLSTDSEPIEYRDGSENITVRKIPGLKKYANISLKKRNDQGYGTLDIAQNSFGKYNREESRLHSSSQRGTGSSTPVKLQRRLAHQMGRRAELSSLYTPDMRINLWSVSPL
ncbi:MAG: phage tail protein, partial [Planctomycetota bacterium]